MKALVTYFKKRKSALNLILEKKPKSYAVETFHELRVEIKKMKALFELIVFCNKKFRLRKTYKRFRTIFKQAGNIRELQIESNFIEQQPNFTFLKKYPKQLKKYEAQELKKFFLLANKFSIKKLKEKQSVIIDFLAKTSKKKVIRYRNKIKKEIKKLIHKDAFKKNEMHDFRKRLKVYQYNEKIFDADQSSKKNPTQTVLSDMLGEWHDYEVIILHLKKTITFYKTNSKESKHLKTIKTTLTLKRDFLFHEINSILPKYSFL